MIAGLAAGAYFFLKAPDDTEAKEWRNATDQLHQENDLPAVETEQQPEIELESTMELDCKNPRTPAEELECGAIAVNSGQNAYIDYYENGEIDLEVWYSNDQEHRENDQPAYIVYGENGEIEYEAWFLSGELIKDQPSSM